MSNITKKGNNENVFERNSLSHASIEFARLKAEKLAIAIHMVTGFVSESEPVRSRLRESSLELFSKLSLRNNPSTMDVSEQTIPGSVLEVIGLLDVAHASGYVSDMNWDILRKEYISFISFLKERSDTFASDGMVFSDTFFDVPETVNIPDTASKQIHTPLSKSGVISVPASRQEVKKKAQKQSVGVVDERRGSRREIILNILQKQKQITVKDVSARIQNCSEKTLQRELNNLVVNGTLRKEGERRWSTYHLA